MQKTFVDFEEFVAVTLYQKDREPVTIFDAEVLKSAGLNRAYLDKYKLSHPLPLQEIRNGQTHIVNATLDPALPLLLVAIHPTGEQEMTVASGLIRLDRLLQFNRQSQVFDTFLINSAGSDLINADNMDFQGTTHSLPVKLSRLEQEGGLGAVHEYKTSRGDIISAAKTRP